MLNENLKMLLFVGILYCSILSTHAVLKLKPLTGDVEHVTVNEIKTGRIRRATRDVQQCHFRPTLHFTFLVQGERITLNLERNVYLSKGAPIYITDNGNSILEEKNSSNRFAVYQDVSHGSALLVTCQDDNTYRLHGSFNHNGVLYHMSHSDVPEASKKHFIQQTHTTNKNFVKDTELPSDDHDNVKRRVLEAVVSRRSNNDETPIPGGNIVELLFTVDKALYDKFAEMYGSEMAKFAIEQYVALLANEIDLYFCSVDIVDPDYSIKIYLAGVVIPKADSEVLWSKNAQSVVLECFTYLDMSRILSDLTIWHQREEGLPQHDFLMGLSTLDLADLETTPISTGFEGLSYRESVCSSENKVSFVEVDGTRVALTAAHELAHGLGAFHDGEEDSADCPASAQNIMSPEITLTTNLTYSRAQWSFSACSVASFKSYIDGLENNCLKQHAFTGLEFEELQAKSLPGTVYSLNQQCQMYNGIWSTSCESTIKEEACYTGYHCSTRSDLPVGCEEAHHPLYPLAGTPCGAVADKKWCYRGRCVGNTSPTTTTSSPNICTTTTSTSTTTSTTEAPTTTTVAPCKQGKQCCVKVNGKKKCCKGTKCCKIAEAAKTDCYKSCCATENTTQGPTSAPCFGGKCCSKIEVNGALKKVCCKKAKCCKTSWGKETKCCLTCSKK